MIMNFDGKVFRSVSNTENGEVSGETLFRYRQNGPVISADYSGGAILSGHLIALADVAGVLDMRYHHINQNGEIHTGICRSVPEILPDGRVRLHETWRWTSGDGSSGSSVVEEVLAF